MSILAGLVIGYVLATVSESWLHRSVGHASANARRRWATRRWIGWQLTQAHFGHSIVHHAKTFRKNHVTQFVSPSEQQLLDQYLFEKGQQVCIGLRYGLITDAWGSCLYITIPATSSVLISLLVFGKLSIGFLASAAIPICSTPLLSLCVHPYLHLPCERTISEAPRVIRWLLSTPYGSWARTQHFIHHRTPRFNFNLLPGGDILLRTHRRPTQHELLEMREIGLLPADR